MERERLNELFTNYLKDNLPKDELLELQQLILKEESMSSLDPILKAAFQESDFAEEDAAAGSIVWNQLTKAIQKEQRSPLQKWYYRIAVAASIVIAACFGGYFYNQLKKGPQVTIYVNDIAPGKQGATLTLANGKKIKLNNAANGELAKEAEVEIIKTASGQLIYEIKSVEGQNARSVSYNTLTTANGETYQVKLPDGTMIWLNSASSLTYPASFAKTKVRKVELSGEGYFEVAKDKIHPFLVKTENQMVQVLGTHFNINSYRNEKHTKTTLLEGSISITPVFNLANETGNDAVQKKEIILKPNQQSELTDQKITVKDVEVEDAIDWKNGYFMFNNENLESIMNRISRWYNVELQYQDVYFGESGLLISGQSGR